MIKRVDVMLNRDEYSILKEYYKGNRLSNFFKEKKFEIEGVKCLINFHFNYSWLSIEVRAYNEREILSSANLAIESIKDFINVYRTEFYINKQFVKLFINIDVEYDTVHFNDISEFYEDKLDVLEWKVSKNRLDDLYNCLVCFDFNKNKDILCSCFILNLYFSRIGIRPEIIPHIKLFKEKLEFAGIPLMEIENIVNNKKLNVIEIIDNFFDK